MGLDAAIVNSLGIAAHSHSEGTFFGVLCAVLRRVLFCADFRSNVRFYSLCRIDSYLLYIRAAFQPPGMLILPRGHSSRPRLLTPLFTSHFPLGRLLQQGCSPNLPL